MKEITVTIAEDGKVTIGVAGVSGRACLELTRDLERALGDAARVKRDLKPEFHRQEGGQHAAQG